MTGVKKRDRETLVALTVEQVEKAICEKEPNHFLDYKDWAHDCHSVSLAIVKSDLFSNCRVARGTCLGVLGQHSWVVLGDDCYDRAAPVLDATLWSFDNKQPVLWKGKLDDGLHTPHGAGSIWKWGCPESGGGKEIDLTPATPLSGPAETFLGMLRDTAGGPLDYQFWMNLASSAPVGNWPAGEILAAMDDTPKLQALVPIDRLGMLTSRNPGGLYLKAGKVTGGQLRVTA